VKDNHWFNCLAGCAAASTVGIKAAGDAGRGSRVKGRRRLRTLAELAGTANRDGKKLHWAT
jgi:hypothetical protein